jgi:hypothetical protein
MITVLLVRTVVSNRLHYEVMVGTPDGLWRRKWRSVGESDRVCRKIADEQEDAAARLLSPSWDATWDEARKPHRRAGGWLSGKRNQTQCIW